MKDSHRNGFENARNTKRWLDNNHEKCFQKLAERSTAVARTDSAMAAANAPNDDHHDDAQPEQRQRQQG